MQSISPRNWTSQVETTQIANDSLLRPSDKLDPSKPGNEGTKGGTRASDSPVKMSVSACVRALTANAHKRIDDGMNAVSQSRERIRERGIATCYHLPRCTVICNARTVATTHVTAKNNDSNSRPIGDLGASLGYPLWSPRLLHGDRICNVKKVLNVKRIADITFIATVANDQKSTTR